MEEKLVVKVGAQEFEVEVSAGGMFYDKATKKVSAKTLSSLEKKLRALHGPKGGIQVEDWESGKRGIAIGRVKSRGWRRSYVNIRWDDGHVTEEWPHSLCPLLPAGVREEKARLEQVQEVAKAAWDAAGTALSDHRAKYQVEQVLDTAFPTD